MNLFDLIVVIIMCLTSIVWLPLVLGVVISMVYFVVLILIGIICLLVASVLWIIDYIKERL